MVYSPSCVLVLLPYMGVLQYSQQPVAGWPWASTAASWTQEEDATACSVLVCPK